MNQEYKTYIVGGVPRAGKSILRNQMLKKHGIPGITTDVIRDALYKTYPEHNDFKQGPDIKRADSFSNLWLNIINQRRHYPDNFVLEGVNFLPSTLSQIMEKTYVRICFLIYPNISEEELFARVRKNDGEHDWTADCSDEMIKSLCKIWITDSLFIQEECERHKYNTSTLQQTFTKCRDFPVCGILINFIRWWDKIFQNYLVLIII